MARKKKKDGKKILKASKPRQKSYIPKAETVEQKEKTEQNQHPGRAQKFNRGKGKNPLANKLSIKHNRGYRNPSK